MLARALSSCFERLATLSNQSDASERHKLSKLSISNDDTEKKIKAPMVAETISESSTALQKPLHLSMASPFGDSKTKDSAVLSTGERTKSREPFLLVDDNPVNLKVLHIFF